MAMVTRLEEEKREYRLEPQDYGYIYIKSDFVMKFMKGENRLLTNAEGLDLQIKEMRSYQRAFFILVHMDEWLAGLKPSQTNVDSTVAHTVKTNSVDKLKNMIKKTYDIQEAFKWWYKPEVTFSMPKSLSGVPVPHLIKNKDEIQDKNRRHSPNWRSPVVLQQDRVRSKISVKKQRRRPDLIIVKDENIKWPGREIDAEDSLYNEEYDDNLKCLVEMKFPGDKLSEDQEEDYIQIATEKRLSVVHIRQDEREDLKQFTPDFVPVFATKNLPDPYKLEKWVSEGVRPIDIIGDKVDGNLENVFRPETLVVLNEMSPWLVQEGEFVETADTVSWISKDGNTTIEHSKQEIASALEYMDNQMGLNDADQDLRETDRVILPTIVMTASRAENIPENVTITMTTKDKVLLALDFGVTVASVFVPAIGLAKLAIFGYRFYKTVKAAQKIKQASQVLAPAF